MRGLLYPLGDNQTNKRDRDLQQSGAPELGIIIPTFNEADNVPVVVDRIHSLYARARQSASANATIATYPCIRTAYLF